MTREDEKRERKWRKRARARPMSRPIIVPYLDARISMVLVEPPRVAPRWDARIYWDRMQADVSTPWKATAEEVLERARATIRRHEGTLSGPWPEVA